MDQVKSLQNIRTKKRRDKAHTVIDFISYSAKKKKREARFCILERIKSEKQSQDFCILLKINRTWLLVVDFNSYKVGSSLKKSIFLKEDIVFNYLML